jgi:azurin
MKFINILAAFSLILFIGCGGGSEEQQETETTTEAQETEMASDVRTIDIIGIDQMKFAIEDEDQEGITLGDPVGADNLPKLESISVEPGEEFRIRLTTRSSLPATAMAHNWVLLTMGADGQAFSTAAAQAKDNEYIPADMTDQIIAHTDLAAGGETVEITLTAPEESGNYEFLCSFPGHYAASMKGTLVVGEPEAPASE